MTANISLVPRPHPDFISQPWRKMGDYKHWTPDPRTGDPRTPPDPRTGEPEVQGPNDLAMTEMNLCQCSKLKRTAVSLLVTESALLYTQFTLFAPDCAISHYRLAFFRIVSFVACKTTCITSSRQLFAL